MKLHGTPCSGGITGTLNPLRRLLREFIKTSEEINRNAVAYKCCRLSFDRLGEEGEELIHLTVITTPVLATECVDSQVRNAKFRGTSDDASQRFGSCGMTIKFITALCSGPAPISVHDDGDMARQALCRRSAMDERWSVNRTIDATLGQPSRTSRSLEDAMRSISAIFASVAFCKASS